MNGYYQISNLGRIKSLERIINFKDGRKRKFGGNIRALGYDKDGYTFVDLYNQDGHTKFKIHRLVAETFIPNPNNLPQINNLNRSKRR